VSNRDLAVDLGTANTLVYQQGRGVVYDEPTVVAVNARSGQVLAAGSQAWRMLAESPGNVQVVRPLERGVIADFEMTASMLRLIMRSLGVARFPRPRALVCVPASSTKVERRAVEEAVTSAGLRSATLVEETLAAAVGAGLPIHEPVGSLVVDIGGGTTEVAVVAMGGIVTGSSMPVGGFDLDAAIQRHIRQRYGVAIGDRSAERVKVELGSAYPAADTAPLSIRGRDMATAVPAVLEISPEEIRECLREHVSAMVETTTRCLADAPAELAHDVLERGIFLTGGSGLLRGLDMRLSTECEVPVHMTERPLETVVLGAGRLLEYMPDYRSAFVAASRWA
jgi:rod shape-determining protein MreB and related proteins